MLYRAVVSALQAKGVARTGTARVLVACSGGPDSVALAHVAFKLYGARRVVLGHVDHGVRPDSWADAAAVAELGRQLGCWRISSRLASGPADEARLRTERYRALEAQRRACGAAVVLTAHTEDDQAETILMGLIRSAQPQSLLGMAAERGLLVRPWLAVPRSHVHDHIRRHRLPTRVDPSNREPMYLRNRLRKELLPLIETRYRPGFGARLARLAARLRALGGGDEIQAGPGLGRADLGAGADLAALATAVTKGRARTLAAVLARGARPSAAVTKGRAQPPSAPSPADERALPTGPDLPGPLAPVRLEQRPWVGGTWPRGPHEVVFDAELTTQVVVRRVRPGDRIRPFGLAGHRKVRDVLREGGIEEQQRPLCHVVADGDDRVLWVPGLLRSNLAPVGETTRSVWVARVDRKLELQGGATRATLDDADVGAQGRDDAEGAAEGSADAGDIGSASDDDRK